MAVLTNNVGVEVCELFGFDPMKTRRVEVIFLSGDVVLVNATMFADKGDLSGLFEIVKKFKLVSREDEE